MFHGMVLLNAISESPIVGVGLAFIPLYIGVSVVGAWLKPKSTGGLVGSATPLDEPALLNFEGLSGDFLYTLALNNDKVIQFAYGRIGTAFMSIGLYVAFVSTTLTVPWFAPRETSSEEGGNAEVGFGDDDDEEEVPDSDVWQPVMWKRAHVLWSNFTLQFFLLWIWEFSYSSTFANNVYTFIVAFKIIQMLMDMLMESILREHLMVNPLVCVIEMTEMLVTMGADSFMDFTLSYFVELCVMALERMYIDPLFKNVAKLIPRWRMLLKRKMGANRRMTREEKAEEEMKWRKITEEIELEAEGIELLRTLTVYSNEVTAMFCMPIVTQLLIDFNLETKIPENYGIRETDLGCYFMFNWYIVLYSLLLDVFILNAQELVHGWKIYDYVSYQRYRFSVREFRWIMDAQVVDESIAEGMNI